MKHCIGKAIGEDCSTDNTCSRYNSYFKALYERYLIGNLDGGEAYSEKDTANNIADMVRFAHQLKNTFSDSDLRTLMR